MIACNHVYIRKKGASVRFTVEVSEQVAEWLSFLSGDENARLSKGDPEVTKEGVASALLEAAFDAARQRDEIPYLPQRVGAGEDDLPF